MKKYLFTFIIALIIGFFLCNFFLNQYEDFHGIKVSSVGNELYFVQYGVYSSIDNMEDNTIALSNYVYSNEDDLYYVYVGITGVEENAKKISNYFKELGYDTIIKKYTVSNKKFIKLLETYDEVLENSEDNTVIISIINQVLEKYEEVVISGGKD